MQEYRLEVLLNQLAAIGFHVGDLNPSLISYDRAKLILDRYQHLVKVQGFTPALAREELLK